MVWNGGARPVPDDYKAGGGGGGGDGRNSGRFPGGRVPNSASVSVADLAGEDGRKPPKLKFTQANRSQRISDAANHSAHSSIRKRNHQTDTEKTWGTGRASAFRS